MNQAALRQVTCGLLLACLAAASFAQKPASAPATPQYQPSRSASTNREADRPSYVKTVGERFGQAGFWSGMEFGLEQRTRFEIRDDFYRANRQRDTRFLMRSRGWLGLRETLDPFRMGFEFQDSRRFGSILPTDPGDIDENDILQAFGELYFKDAAGPATPLSLRAGRMAFDVVDRRLISRNRFRNTTNAFDGFRLRIGDDQSKREFDLFAFQPVERLERRPDRPEEERWLYGMTAYLRDLSPHVTLEPYYLILDEDRKENPTDRELHTIGAHAYGLIGESGFDYDLDFAFQFGQRTGGDIRAFASHTELGYRFKHAWEPRLAFIFNYASGEDDPTDSLDERFDSLFGSSHTFHGYGDLFTWENTLNPQVYLSLQPAKNTRIEAYYRAYWNESARDGFILADIIDPAGGSGRFAGQEVDFRIRQRISSHALLDVGYAHFWPGSFVRRASGDGGDSDFFYVELTLSF